MKHGFKRPVFQAKAGFRIGSEGENIGAWRRDEMVVDPLKVTMMAEYSLKFHFENLSE
jgi:arginine/lysine/ornithine decarboxylase